MGDINIDIIHNIRKGIAFFSILLSSLPLSFSNIIDLLVLTHTNFAEWDINIAPANIEFLVIFFILNLIIFNVVVSYVY